MQPTLESIAVKQYHIFKMGAGKTLKSILISAGVRLAAFNLPQIARLTCTDDLHLEQMGERKIALFAVSRTVTDPSIIWLG